MSNLVKWLDRDDGPVNYGEPTYWERRCNLLCDVVCLLADELDRKDYGQKGYRHDWYCGFEKLKATIESYFEQPKGQRILVVGCGHSNVPREMHEMGYRCIVALDISATVIASMQADNEDQEGIEYIVGDARKMDSFPDDLFDCTFDKACADSLMCGTRSTGDVVDMFFECCRVLRPKGVFLCVSHGDPDARMHIFRHEGLQWNTNAIPLHGCEGLFVYVCTKWSREEIDAVKQRQLDDLQSLMSMRTRSSHSRSLEGVRRGILHENVIVHARAPHEIDAVVRAGAQQRDRHRENGLITGESERTCTSARATHAEPIFIGTRDRAESQRREYNLDASSASLEVAGKPEPAPDGLTTGTDISATVLTTPSMPALIN